MPNAFPTFRVSFQKSSSVARPDTSLRSSTVLLPATSRSDRSFSAARAPSLQRTTECQARVPIRYADFAPASRQSRRRAAAAPPPRSERGHPAVGSLRSCAGRYCGAGTAAGAARFWKTAGASGRARGRQGTRMPRSLQLGQRPRREAPATSRPREHRGAPSRPTVCLLTSGSASLPCRGVPQGLSRRRPQPWLL